MSDSSFEYFYNIAKNKAEEALKIVYSANLNKEELSQKAVFYFYKTLPINEKNIFEYIAILNEEEKDFLQTQSYKVKFSIESLTKNIIRHSEITLTEYLLISEIVDKPELLIYSRQPKT